MRALNCFRCGSKGEGLRRGHRLFRTEGARRTLQESLRSASRREGRPIDRVNAAIHGLGTARERQIALLVSDGMSNKHLARQLDLTEGTVSCVV